MAKSKKPAKPTKSKKPVVDVDDDDDVPAKPSKKSRAAARDDDDAPAGPPKPPNDAYTGMLLITLVCLIFGSVLLYLDHDELAAKTQAPPAVNLNPNGLAVGPPAAAAGQ